MESHHLRCSSGPVATLLGGLLDESDETDGSDESDENDRNDKSRERIRNTLFSLQLAHALIAFAAFKRMVTTISSQGIPDEVPQHAPFSYLKVLNFEARSATILPNSLHFFTSSSFGSPTAAAP